MLILRRNLNQDTEKYKNRSKMSRLANKTLYNFSRHFRIKYLVMCTLLGSLFGLGYLLWSVGISRHGRVKHGSMEEYDFQEKVSIHQTKPRKLREIKSLRKKENSNLWQQIIGHQDEKLARLSGTTLLNETGIKILERKSQDFYLKVLKSRGQVIETKDGGSWIVSYPQIPVKIPARLKEMKIGQFSKVEQIWINVTHFPWPNDPHCYPYSVQFGRPHRLAQIGIVSYPSSGNTWIRYLIEGVTGYFTGSMYNDHTIAKKGFCGESMPYDAGITIAIKSHGHTTGYGSRVNITRQDQIEIYNHVKEFNGTAILLIRNPFKAIVGHRHLDEGGHTGLAPLDRFEGEDWDLFVERKISHWENLYLDWLADGTKLIIVHYENLKDDLEISIRQIVSFLGLKVDEDRLQCVLQNPVGHFLRTSNGTKSLLKNPFSSAQKFSIFSAIDRVNTALILAGKESLPLHKYKYS